MHGLLLTIDSTVCDGKDAIVFSAKCKKHSREDMEEWQEEKEKEKRFVRLQVRISYFCAAVVPGVHHCAEHT